jgi:RNAse (barnase) inhibitor barstar
MQQADTMEEALASHPDATPHVVDGPGSKGKFMTAVAAALSFPDWFGRNLDALADSVRDLSWLPPGEHLLVWRDPAKLRGGDPFTFHQLEEILDGVDGHRAGEVTLHVVTVP